MKLFINVETTLIELSCFNVDDSAIFSVNIWLMKVKHAHVYRCCFKVDKTTLEHRG